MAAKERAQGTPRRRRTKAAAAVAALKARGFESPYLKAFVLARLNPLRFQRGAQAEFDETIETLLERAQRFDATKVKADQVVQASGPPEA